jgi:hypothetical protein
MTPPEGTPVNDTDQLVKDINALVRRVEATASGLSETAPGRAALATTEHFLTRAIVAAEAAGRWMQTAG